MDDIYINAEIIFHPDKKMLEKRDKMFEEWRKKMKVTSIPGGERVEFDGLDLSFLEKEE